MYGGTVPLWVQVAVLVLIVAPAAFAALNVRRRRGTQPWWRAGRSEDERARDAEFRLRFHRRHQWE